MAHCSETLTNLISSSPSTKNNWSFIDLQNVYKATKEAGWFIDWNRFRIYLRKQFFVSKAIIFLGYLPEYESFYNILYYAGFKLEFREVIKRKDGSVDGGNVDADITGYMMDFKSEYSRAILIADDGDYCKTIQSLLRQNKLQAIISSHTIKESSQIIKRTVNPEMIFSIQNLKDVLEKSVAA